MDPMGYSSKARFYVRSAWNSMADGMGNGNLGVDESFANHFQNLYVRYNLGVAPSQDASHHQDYEPVLIGNPYKPSFATVTGRGPHPRYNAIASFSGVSNRTVNYFGKQKKTSKIPVSFCVVAFIWDSAI